jgi:hypothetical protein
MVCLVRATPDFRASVDKRAVASFTGPVVLVVRKLEDECEAISQLTAVVNSCSS